MIFWLSFADDEGFLGACVVSITDKDLRAAAREIARRFPNALEGAEKICAAINVAHRLGCNPGGEVQGYQLPDDAPALRYYPQGVLMDRETIEQIDEKIKKAATH